MPKKTFPLGFWNYARMDGVGPNPVKDWVDAGMNLVLSPHFRPDEDTTQSMLDLLDECQKNGVQMIIDDPRCGWAYASTDPEKYKARFLEMYNAYGQHPAVYGYYVGDEPRADQMADALAAVKLQREMAPDKVPFINFNPYWDGNEKVLNGMSFDEWIDDFVQKSGLQQLSYDRYSQMNPPDATESGIHEYYQSLRYFMDAAKRNNIPLWVSNLSVGHFRYRCPREDDFRWQLNTSVACGAKCVWWFFFYMRLCRINYRVAPIDEHGERTETYRWLSRVQRTFQHQFGSLFMHLEHDETYMVGHAYGGYPILEYKRHPLVNQVTCDHNLPALVSFFHMEDGTKYMALVNNSQTESGYFRTYFSPKAKNIYRVTYSFVGKPVDGMVASSGAGGIPVGDHSYLTMPYGGYEVNIARNDVCNGYKLGEDGVTHNGAWLAPGQMEVFRIEE